VTSGNSAVLHESVGSDYPHGPLPQLPSRQAKTPYGAIWQERPAQRLWTTDDRPDSIAIGRRASAEHFRWSQPCPDKNRDADWLHGPARQLPSRRADDQQTGIGRLALWLLEHGLTLNYQRRKRGPLSEMDRFPNLSARHSRRQLAQPSRWTSLRRP
jgi:hypothetical protein